MNKVTQFIVGLIVSASFLYVTLERNAQDVLYATEPGEVNQAYLYTVNSPITPTTVLIDPTKLRTLGAKFASPTQLCSCVGYARSQSPKNIPFPTDARDIKPNAAKPTLGAWVLLQTGNPYGHVAVVLEVLPGEIRITEANFKPCERTERILSVDDPSILGYYD